MTWIMPKVRLKAERSWNGGKERGSHREWEFDMSHRARQEVNSTRKRGVGGVSLKGRELQKVLGSCGDGSVGKAEPAIPEFNPHDWRVEGEN